MAATGTVPRSRLGCRLAVTVLALLGGGLAQAAAVQAKPTIVTQSAAPATVGANLTARIDPVGLATTYRFEYGLDDTYGSSVPLSEGSIGSASEHGVRERIDGLQPGTTYHFRVVATNADGPTFGPDRFFVTRTAAEVALPRRGIELVNNPDKGVQNVEAPATESERGPYAHSNGILWRVAAGAPGATTGAGNAFLAQRSAGGWHSTGVVPPVDQQLGGGSQRYEMLRSSPGLSRFLFIAVEGLTKAPFAFVRTGPGAPETLFEEPETTNPDGARGKVQASDDLGRVVLYNIKTGRYEDLRSGPDAAADSLPGGVSPPCGAVEPLADSFDDRGLSADGSALYFLASPDCVVPPQLYRRDFGSGTTELVSGPPLSGAAERPTFIRPNADGSAAMYATRARLDPADGNAVADIYRWTVGGGNTCLTCAASNASGVGTEVSTPQPGREVKAVASADLAYVYFSIEGQLIPGVGDSNGSLYNLYVAHGGEVSFVGTMLAEQGGLAKPWAGLSAGGRVLTFGSVHPLTGDPIQSPCPPSWTNSDEHPCMQLYRYDDAAGNVECVSCAPIGTTEGESLTQTVSPNFQISAGGDVVAFQTTAKLLPDDVNRTIDVYEWRNGALGLITDGVTEFDADGKAMPTVWAMDASGDNLFFSAARVRTGFEHDGLANLYDARVGGGFAPPSPASRCEGDSCQGPIQAAPSLGPPGSATAVGPANLRTKAQKRLRCRKKASRQVRNGKRCAGKRSTSRAGRNKR